MQPPGRVRFAAPGSTEAFGPPPAAPGSRPAGV